MNFILFDMDGTLWDTSLITLEAANNVASRHDDMREFKLNTIQECMGLSKKDVAYRYMPYLDEEKRNKYQEEIFIETSLLLNKKGGKAYDGVIDTIKVLSKYYKLGIVTNNTSEYAKTFVNSTGTNSYFTLFCGAASYSLSKGDMIKKVIKDNNIDKAIYVGDTIMDLEAARVANIPFVYARYGFGDVKNTEYAINEFKDILKFLVK